MENSTLYFGITVHTLATFYSGNTPPLWRHPHCDPGKHSPGRKFAHNSSNVHNIDQNAHVYVYSCNFLVTFFSRSIIWDSIFRHGLLKTARRIGCNHLQGLTIKIIIVYSAIVRGHSKIKISADSRSYSSTAVSQAKGKRAQPQSKEQQQPTSYFDRVQDVHACRHSWHTRGGCCTICADCCTCTSSG